MADSMQVNGIQLCWEKRGTIGEPLVLVHGSWSDHHEWDAMAANLSPSVQVYSYDRSGHSQSEGRPSPDSIQDDVNDLAELVEGQGIAPAHILGNSFGGSIVLRLASERPDLFRSLLVHEPPLLGLLADDLNYQNMFREAQQRLDDVEKTLADGDMEGGTRQFIETVAFGPGAWEEIPQEEKEALIANAPTFLDELHDPDGFTLDLDSLRTFSKPALLTTSDHGLPFAPPIVDKVARALPQAKQEELTDADHTPETSQPDAYARTVLDFITSVSARG